MAYADWVFQQDYPTWFQGGADLLGVAHTLAGAGDRLRRATGATPFPAYYDNWGSLALAALQERTDCATIAVSQRAWVRYTESSRAISWGTQTGLVLAARGYYSGGLQIGQDTGIGYKLLVGTGNGLGQKTTFGIRLAVAGNIEYGTTEAVVTSPSQGAWYAIRLDYIPLSSTRHLIRAYTGTGVPMAEVWTLQKTRITEYGAGNGFVWDQVPGRAFGMGYEQTEEVDASAQMDVHHYRALVMTGGPFPDQE